MLTSITSVHLEHSILHTSFLNTERVNDFDWETVFSLNISPEVVWVKKGCINIDSDVRQCGTFRYTYPPLPV